MIWRPQHCSPSIRPGVVLAVLALAGILLIANAAPLQARKVSGTGGAKPDCLKIWHKKRIVKYLHRHGKKVKVHRKKVWWTCDPLEAAGPPRLGVTAKEYKLTLSRPTVRSGDLILEFNNRGEDRHNLRIKRIGRSHLIGSIPKTPPRQAVTRTFPLKPGIYRLYCSLPQHARLGMKAKLKVVG